MRFIKAGEKVKENLTLPKDIHWKIFGKLIGDLWSSDAFLSGTTPESVAFVDDIFVQITEAIRHRCPDRLAKVLTVLTPRCIVEGVGARRENAFLFFVLYQAGAFLKKYPFRAKEAKENALRKFKKLELRCQLFNAENFRAICKLNDWHEDFLNVLEEMRADIKGVLGEFPPEGMLCQGKHGPGATVESDSSTGEVTTFFKYRDLPYSVTASALPYAKAVISSDERWLGALDEWYRLRCNNLYGPIDLEDFWSRIFRVVDCSRITTVPKSFETDRTIAIEPRLNVFLQIGVDRYLRKAIKRCWGFDLDDQEYNQILAYLGSRFGGLATLDLAGASDTVALICCLLLLPPAWFDLLLDLRCSRGKLPGTDSPITFEKISSMGNGYTFALETLIFGAAVRAAVRRTKSSGPSCVYGDDIILPTEAATYVIELLELLGFELNKDKSFLDGPFRESCGKDYFHGIAVRPIFLKEKVKFVSDLFYVHNSLFDLERGLPWAWGVNLSETRRFIRKYIPKHIREQFYGPSGESKDTYLFSERKLRQEKWRERSVSVVYSLTPRAQDFERLGKGYHDFHFRKLMATLGAKEPPRLWEKGRTRHLPANGNVFRITKRSRVTLKCTRTRLPYVGGECW